MSYVPPTSTNNGVGCITIDGNKSCVISENGINLTMDILTTPISTIINPSGFDTGGQQVSFTNLYNLKQATPALRIPATTNVYVVNNTYEANDDNLAKTRIASLSAIPAQDTKLTLKANTGGAVWEEADLTQNTLTYIESNTTTHTKPLIELVNTIPTYVVSGNSNNPVGIPVYTNNHQIVLQSAPVPLIDTLVPTIYSFPSGETPLCSEVFNGNTYIGCMSGNVYYNDGSNWVLVATFDGEVRCLYNHQPQGRLYIGGKYGNISYPLSQTGLNYVCYTQSSNFSTIGVDVFSNYGVNGFDGAVNAITSDNNFMYFGGEFQYITGSGLNCRYIACYDWSSTQYIYDLGGTGSGGFDNNVFGLAIANNLLCVGGEFNTIYSNIGNYSGQYLVGIGLSSGWLVGSVSFINANPNAISNALNRYGLIQTDGNTFFVSTNDNSIGGIQYFLQTPYYSFPSASSIGSNAYGTQQTSFTRYGGIASVGYDNVYLLNGEQKTTLPFQPYIYWNAIYSRNEFMDINTGSTYIFAGSTENNFVLQGGRTIIHTGTTYNTGWKINTNSGNGYGWSATMLWNGANYIPMSIPYGYGY